MSRRIPHEIIDRASEWLIENREPGTSEGEREAFADWLRQSPVHLQAYIEVASLWEDAAGIGEQIGAQAVDTNVVSLNVGGRSAPRRSPRAVVGEFDRTDADIRVQRQSAHQSVARGTTHPGRRRFLLQSAAIIAAAAIGAGLWFEFARAPVYSAEIGEQRVLTLDDGSVVRLNSRSRLSVNLTPEQRSIELLAGQAMFQVTKDPRRPFVVRSGEAAIRAVGTAFDVYMKTGGTVVTVVEGQVVVASSGDREVQTGHSHDRLSGPSGVPVSAGEQAVVNELGAITHTPHANVAAATSWLQRELIFAGEPLSEVIQEFNRYSKRTIVLNDAALGELRINAVFHSTNPDALLTFISRYDGVEVTETRTEIRIARREP